MALTRKRPKRPARHQKRNRQRADLDTKLVVERIDAMVRELEEMRRVLTAMPKRETPAGLTEELFGALGRGTWEEYDVNLDWARFSE